MAYAPSLAVLAHYFNRRLGLANGIATAGSSVFTALLPIPLAAMMDAIGLQNTFRVMAVLTLSVALCGIAFKTPVVMHSWIDEEKEPSGCCEVLNKSIWKNRRFVVWVIAIPLALFGYFVPYVHLVQHVEDVFPDANGETLVTCMGITSGLGRILFGRLADLPSVSPVVLQQVSFMAMGLLTLSIAAAHTYVSLVLVCLLLGLCDGCFISLIGPAAQRLTGTRGASQAIGFLLGFCSVPLTAGPPCCRNSLRPERKLQPRIPAGRRASNSGIYSHVLHTFDKNGPRRAARRSTKGKRHPRSKASQCTRGFRAVNQARRQRDCTPPTVSSPCIHKPNGLPQWLKARRGEAVTALLLNGKPNARTLRRKT
ncbi:hypothetical protein MTO96_007728 [Rhipicephalus appendiculatus]